MMLILGSKILLFTGKLLRVLLQLWFVPKPSITMHKGSICGLKKTSRVSQVLLLGLGLNAQCVLLVKTHEVIYM